MKYWFYNTEAQRWEKLKSTTTPYKIKVTKGLLDWHRISSYGVINGVNIRRSVIDNQTFYYVRDDDILKPEHVRGVYCVALLPEKLFANDASSVAVTE